MKACLLAALCVLLVVAVSGELMPRKTMEMLKHKREILEADADACAAKFAAMPADEKEAVRRDIVNGDWSKVRSVLSERALAEVDALPAEEIRMVKKNLGKLVEKRGLGALDELRRVVFKKR